MALLGLDALRRSPLTCDPFMFTVVPDFVPLDNAKDIRRDFPHIVYPGLLPVEATSFGPSFGALVQELRTAAVAQAFSEKFQIDLVGRPLMITVRGRCQEKDGRIHTDSEAKLVSALLYFNDKWEARGGQLRLLRGPDNLDDAIAEVPPDSGTLVAFRRSDLSFHGHAPYTGMRRYVMLNWMATNLAARRELMRHRLSARAKRALTYPASPVLEDAPATRNG